MSNTESYFIVNPSESVTIKDSDANSLLKTTRGCITLISYVLENLLRLPFILGGLLLLLVALMGMYQQFHLQFYGTETVVAIRDAEFVASGKGDFYRISYQYIVNGTMYTEKDTISAERYNRITRFNPLRVYYSSLDPNIISKDGTNWLGIIALCVFAVYWNGSVWRDIWKRFNPISLETDTIIDGWLVKVDILTHSICVKYGFISPKDGKTIYGNWAGKRPDLKNMTLPPADTRIKVKYVTNTVHKPL